MAGIDVRSFEHTSLPRYANQYDAQGNRTQLLLSEGAALEVAPFLKPGETPDVVFITPAYHEFRRAPLRFKGSIVGVSLQGPLRSTDSEQRVVHRPDAAGVARRFIRAGWISFFSEEDTDHPESLARSVVDLRGVAVLTRGYNGATLFDSDGSQHHWDAIAAEPVDPTGAGDCFASAFLFRLAEAESLASAMQFALAAGALAVEGTGPDGVPTRTAIEARMTREAA